MTMHRDSRLIRCPAEDVFALVADVERYPEFLSLWRQARIYEREGDTYWTEQELGLGPVRERFRTRTDLIPSSRIEVTSADDLFRSFVIQWEFTPARTSCRASVALKWELKSRALQRAIDLLLPSTARTMVSAFQARAERGGR